MLEISWHLRHGAAACVEVLVRPEDREQCFGVLHLEPQWRLEEVADAADVPEGAVMFIYRRATS